MTSQGAPSRTFDRDADVASQTITIWLLPRTRLDIVKSESIIHKSPSFS